MKRRRQEHAPAVLDRRALLKGLSFAGAAVAAPPSFAALAPARLPTRADSASPDWTALAARDHKPIRPDFRNVHATGRRRMVTSDHPLATRAALNALERGGSAADAYMTAALAQCVLEPTMTTLGGGFGMTLWRASERRLEMGGGAFSFPESISATEPWDEQKSWTGWGAMVPGYVRGLEACHRAWGRLPWRDLFEPAVTFAEQGFVIDHLLFAYAKEARKMIGRYPGSGRNDWFRDGYMLGVGDTLRQPALARTLRMLRDDQPAFAMATPSRSFIECMLQATANVVEYEMPLAEAARAPRFGHPHPGMNAAEIEAAFPEEFLAELERRGHVLFPVSPNDVNAGCVQGVHLAANGTLHGVADPRRRGLASGA